MLRYTTKTRGLEYSALIIHHQYVDKDNDDVTTKEISIIIIIIVISIVTIIITPFNIANLYVKITHWVVGCLQH